MSGNAYCMQNIFGQKLAKNWPKTAKKWTKAKKNRENIIKLCISMYFLTTIHITS